MFKKKDFKKPQKYEQEIQHTVFQINWILASKSTEFKKLVHSVKTYNLIHIYIGSIFQEGRYLWWASEAEWKYLHIAVSGHLGKV